MCFGLLFEIWNFSGAWGLVLVVSLGSGSKTEMHPQIGSLASGLVTSALSS